MAFSDRELFARLIQCEAGGEGVVIKVHKNLTCISPAHSKTDYIQNSRFPVAAY